jgi:hypothetical protein
VVVVVVDEEVVVVAVVAEAVLEARTSLSSTVHTACSDTGSTHVSSKKGKPLLGLGL